MCYHGLCFDRKTLSEEADRRVVERTESTPAAGLLGHLNFEAEEE